ncbi:MAG: MgtC/SapB family protein [Bacteroidales bacterium]|nr:MgtC/SapB family protein [Bacteroidales bacterium]
MDEINELINDTSINAGTVLLKISVSLILGLMIGAERQMRRRDAGLRTFTLICLGSTGAMLISIWIPQIYPDFLNGDPGRIAAQVLTGVGFLGAGAIARGKGSVQGLTTAACIWMDAVIGLAVGAGLYFGAIIATIATLFVLVSVEKIEQKLTLGGANRILTLKCETDTPDVDSINRIIKDAGIRIGSMTYSIDLEAHTSVLTYRVTVVDNASQTLLYNSLQTNETICAISMMV